MLSILHIGAMLLGSGASATAAFEAPPLVPERVQEAARPQDAGQVLTRWSQRDGLPAAPDYLVATPGGLLLLSSEDRLYRFDGARFSVVEDADGAPLVADAIMGADRGEGEEVWFRTRAGQAVRIGPRGVQRYGEESGFLKNTDIRRVVVAGNDILAATSVGLYRLYQGRWTPLALEGLLGRNAFNLAFDGQRWWAIVDSSLVAITRDLRSLEVVRELDPETDSGLIGHPGVGVWYWQTSGNRNLCRLDAQEACYQLPGVYFPESAADGSIRWVDGPRVLAFDDGTRAGRRARLTAVDTGLPLDEIELGLDGTVWAVAGGHLARLAPTPVEVVPVPAGAVLPAPGDDMWVGAFGIGMLRVGKPEPSASLYVNEEGHLRAGPWPTTDGRKSRRLSAAAAAMETRPVVLQHDAAVPYSIVQMDALDGDRVMAATLASPALWVGDAEGWQQYPSPPLEKGSVVRGIARNRAGDIVVGAMRDREGLYRFDGTRWLPLPSRGDGRADVVAMHLDDQDRLWIGSRGSVILVADGKTLLYGPDEGLMVGAVRAIRQVDGEIWVAGHKGVARFRGGSFDTLVFDARVPLSGVTGFAFDDAGAMWLGTAQGIARISKAAWSSAIGTSGTPARVTLLGELAGVEHPIVQTAPLPTVTRADDGKFWFYTLGALYRLDPQQVPPPRPAPPLAISSVTVDGVRHAPGDAIRVPAGARRLVFAFHALAPVVPNRTMFRYRITGTGDGWAEVAGGEVVLDRMPPGDYAFELQSSAEDGEWADKPSIQRFSIPPTFLQSIWSKLLFLLLAVAITAVVILLRARQLDARRRVLVEAKIQEREKIARDMHDTLLQGLNGLMMTMQAVVNRLDGGSPERARLERSIGIAERILVEGRDRVSTLRSTQSGGPGLVKALQAHARDLAYERRIQCEVQVIGEPLPMDAMVEDEMLQIGREALTNAFHHSCATEITLCIRYEEQQVGFVVSDNGIGIQPANGVERDHWGMQGMKERSAGIGGCLEVIRRPEGGTRVSLSVPARVACPIAEVRRSTSRWRRIAPWFGWPFR